MADVTPDPARCTHAGCRALGSYRRIADGARLCGHHAGRHGKGWPGPHRTVYDPKGLDPGDVRAFLERAER